MVVHLSSKPAQKEITIEKNSGSQRHMQVSAYRCFLPDLTGFTDLHCIGPEPSGIYGNQIFQVWFLSQEFSPAIADCRYRAPLAPRLARPNASLASLASIASVARQESWTLETLKTLKTNYSVFIAKNQMR